MNFFKLCRSCMKDLAAWDMENFDKRIYEMFLFCTKIQVNVEDTLPNNFCSNCREQIKASYKFIKQSLETNVAFNNIICENEGIAVRIVHQFNDEESSNLYEKSEVTENDEFYETNMNEFDDENSFHNVQDVKIESDDPLLKETTIYNEPKQIIQTTSTDRKDAGKCVKMKPAQNTDKTTADSIMQHNNFDLDSNKQTLNQKNTNSENVVHNLEETKVQTEKDFEKPIPETEEKTLTQLRKRSKNTEYFNDIEHVKDDDRHICPICNKEYASGAKGKRWLTKHLKQHSEKKERERTVIDKNKKIGTSKVKKTIEEKIKHCPKCKKSFTSEIWFTRHMTKHPKQTVIKKYACRICTKTFVTHTEWVHHKSTHEIENKHVCTVCEQRFRLKKQLVSHAMTHSNERPFTCDQCYMSFKMKHVLKKHLRVHTNVKPFLCSTCGKGFATTYYLDLHMTVHTRSRPLSCSNCDFRTGYPSALWKHVHRHSDTPRHKCSHCQKAFYETSGLARHMRIHTGERPYKCPSCPLAFVDGWKRKVHIMRVHQLNLEDIPRLTRDGYPAQL